MLNLYFFFFYSMHIILLFIIIIIMKPKICFIGSVQMKYHFNNEIEEFGLKY